MIRRPKSSPLTGAPMWRSTGRQATRGDGSGARTAPKLQCQSLIFTPRRPLLPPCPKQSKCDESRPSSWKSQTNGTAYELRVENGSARSSRFTLHHAVVPHARWDRQTTNTTGSQQSRLLREIACKIPSPRVAVPCVHRVRSVPRAPPYSDRKPQPRHSLFDFPLAWLAPGSCV